MPSIMLSTVSGPLDELWGLQSMAYVGKKTKFEEALISLHAILSSKKQALTGALQNMPRTGQQGLSDI